ncbi:MAG: hypothetical protein HXX17_01985 [Geobacteraceae bacterium]|nr:hypothetical protein [Geobacteraceae bacterium]
MGNLSSQVKTELRLLPYMLAKLLGGIMAIFGFAAAIVTLTRKDGNSLADILLSGMVCILGIIIFLLSSRMQKRRQPPTQIDIDMQTSPCLLPWIILLMLAAAFLLCTYFITR